MKYNAITSEFRKTRGVNLLDIHKLYEELIDIKNRYEIILYGVLSLRNNVDDIDDQIEANEKYISSGRAERETKEKNDRLKQEAEWDKSNNAVTRQGIL